MRNPRLRGHTLEHEGKPYDRGEEHPWVRVYGSFTGVGLCSCGEASPVLDSDTARKRWHAGHKAARDGREDAYLAYVLRRASLDEVAGRA